MVVADGKGIRLACLTHSAERTEFQLSAETVDQACRSKVPTPLIAKEGYDSDEIRDEMREKLFAHFSVSTESQMPLSSGWPKDASILAQMNRRKNDFLDRVVLPIGYAL